MFNPIAAAKNIKDEFIGYISTLFHISDRDYAMQFVAALQEEGVVSKGSYLDISDSYKTGKSMEDMIEEGEASPLFRGLKGIFLTARRKYRSIEGCIFIKKEHSGKLIKERI